MQSIPVTASEISAIAQSLYDNNQSKFPDFNKVLFTVASAVNHLAREKAYVEDDYFLCCVARAFAGEAASKVARSASEDIQMKELRRLAALEPGNQQVLDEVRTLAQRGCKDAVVFLTEIEKADVSNTP